MRGRLSLAWAIRFMTPLMLAALGLLQPSPGSSQANAPAASPSQQATASDTSDADRSIGLDLDLYAELLERHTRPVTDVVGTRVDYRALARSKDWQALSRQVRSARPSTFDRQGKLAYWINAYNILAIDLVIEHYPVESIRDIGSLFFPVWDRTVATIEGRALSLGDIEHEILRKMGEPRIHAAIVCASTSCPPLARSPFRPSRLDADLDGAMRAWLSSPEKGVSIDRAKGVVAVSQIFDWFEEDFAATGGVLETIAAHVSAEDAAWLRGPGRKARLRHLDYDWTLNDVVSSSR